jgi:hypothetical protein
MHSLHHDITATSSKSPSLPRGLTKFPVDMAHRLAAVALLALIVAIPLAARSTPLPSGTLERGGISHADARFRVGIRIVSSCRVFVTGQGEVRSSCGSSWTPPPHIVAIRSIQNASQSGQVREYAITF